jgi:hypothetical protein
MTPPIPGDSEVMKEFFKLYPPMTRARGLARRKADLAMDEKYAGNYVAYIDTWTGEELDRTVVAVAPGVAEFHDELAKLPPDVRKRVECTHLSPADVISAPSAWLVE